MQSTTTESRLIAAYPQILTTDIEAARAFYVDQLGFTILYEYGKPPFYALVSRDGARLNLRFVHQDLINRDLAAAENVLAAYVPVQGVKDFYLELRERGVRIVQPLTAQPWGVRDVIVADPDGNQLCFAEATDHDDHGPRS
jgi:catechol 2,3-dioxygenase-like lactoylglutathione lyase family enzyme